MDDRKQVGLTEDADEKLNVLRSDTPYFSEEADVYRCAVAVAIAIDASVTESLKKQKMNTKFRVVRDLGDPDGPNARLDTPDGRLARFITTHRPEFASDPYRNSQYLAVAGINFLHKALIDDGLTLSQTLEKINERYTADD